MFQQAGSSPTWDDFDQHGNADLTFGVLLGMPNQDGQPALPLTAHHCGSGIVIQICDPAPSLIGVLHRDPTGLEPDSYQEWPQTSPGIPGTPETGEHFSQLDS